jgi:hypothetical protein
MNGINIIKNRPGALGNSRLKPAQALSLAMGDPEAARFMRAVFSPPEQRSEIFSSSWFSTEGPGTRWMVLIGERLPLRLLGKRRLTNVVLIEIDGCRGAVIRRECLSSLLDAEVRERVNLWLRRGGYKGRRIGSELRQIVR